MVFCTECGIDSNTDDKYCPNCGAKYKGSNVLTRIVISYFIAFILDFITIGGLITLFNNPDIANSYQSQFGTFAYVLGFIIAVIQGIIFNNQFNSYYSDGTLDHQWVYLLIPTFHIIILFLVSVVANEVLLISITSNISVALANVTISGILIGIIFSYSRFSKYSGTQIPTDPGSKIEQKKIIETTRLSQLNMRD